VHGDNDATLYVKKIKKSLVFRDRRPVTQDNAEIGVRNNDFAILSREVALGHKEIRAQL